MAIAARSREWGRYRFTFLASPDIFPANSYAGIGPWGGPVASREIAAGSRA
ncbi:MAG: hypothetical protein LBG06_06850 [Deltaproteobacteria bacterium]|nr:hypothetical protein [Deltaproteobacteria bacterium]